ncbi:MAG: phosphatase PAP2 family protein [Promethearchaeota archaeon]|nr:MAG: phosphatase PAP2 family protein [Candidatus Lokiarchaeota archaeon]
MGKHSMNELKKINQSIIIKLLLLVIVPWIILAIVFGFTDLEISKNIVNRDSEWASFMYIYDEGPAWGLIATSLVVFIGSRVEDMAKQKISAHVAILIGAIIFIIALVTNNTWLVNLGGGITFGVLVFLIFTHDKNWREYNTIAKVFVILAIVNPLLFVQITKLLCGRIRFNNLGQGYSNYTPWFLPPGPNGIQSYSFPSGHTANGWMWLPVLILLRNRKWKDPSRILITVLVLLWGFLVGLSTIIVGAHFASDVLFSSGVAGVSVILLYKKYYFEKK